MASAVRTSPLVMVVLACLVVVLIIMPCSSEEQETSNDANSALLSGDLEVLNAIRQLEQQMGQVQQNNKELKDRIAKQKALLMSVRKRLHSGQGIGRTADENGDPSSDDDKLLYSPKNERQRAVVTAFTWAWKGYKSFAWGHDELQPLSRSYSEWFRLGLTIVDSLDTMYVMGLDSEFAEARQWVATEMNLDQDVGLYLACPNHPVC